MQNKTLSIITCLVFIFISACGTNEPVKEQARSNQPGSAAQKSLCGNGICAAPENASNCPADCAQPTAQLQTQQKVQPSSAEKKNDAAVLYLGVMVHLEGWADGENQTSFTEHVKLIRDYAALFEKYGAKFTWESKEVTDGILKWGDNVLMEMQQRGHAIGLHADLGGNPQTICSTLEPDLIQMKRKLESLGVTVRHTSGVVSHCDWVTASANAGFLFVTGTVEYALKSLPIEMQSQEIRDCKNPSSCHDPYPDSLAERIHPWRANSGADWVESNSNGRLVIMPESGGISHKYEESVGVSKAGKGTEFNNADIDALMAELEQAISLADPNQVNTYYLSWSLGAALDKVLLEKWLQRVQLLVETGKVQWKTIPEMYDAFVSWEKEK